MSMLQTKWFVVSVHWAMDVLGKLQRTQEVRDALDYSLMWLLRFSHA